MTRGSNPGQRLFRYFLLFSIGYCASFLILWDTTAGGHSKCPEVPRRENTYWPPKTVKSDQLLAIRTGQFHWRAV